MGRAVLNELRHSGVEPIVFDRDLRGLHSFKEKTDAVIHLAALSTPGGRPEQDSQNNIDVTNAVLKYAHTYSRRIVFSSSAAVYGVAQSERPVKEDHQLKPVNENGRNKAVCEQLIAQAVSQNEIEAVILRIFNVYGPGQKEPFLIPSLIAGLQNHSEIVLRNSRAVRDFVYIDDVVAAILSACTVGLYEHKVSPLILNLGTAKSVKIIEVLRELEALTGIKAVVRETGALQTEVPFMVADINKAKEILRWQPKIELPEGLKNILGHF